MKRKPRGPKFRNLYAWRGGIWYERVVQKRRHRVDTGVRFGDAGPIREQWNEAAGFRDAYEEKRRVGKRAAFTGAVPAFGEFAARTLADATGDLASTTQVDRRAHLREGGCIRRHLERKRLDEITSATLREWWQAEGFGSEGGRSFATGQRYVASLAAVFQYGQDLGYLEESPVRGLREQLRRRGRTKRGRAEAASGKMVRPIEGADELERLVAAASAEGPGPLVLVLLQLDAGLRLGEALGLRWGSIRWGQDEDDPGRHLWIDKSRPRDGELEDPKSGRERKVQLSRRLRGALATLFEARGFLERPTSYSAETLVLAGVDGREFRERTWSRICSNADLVARKMKDLRDTFASQLFSAGITLQYVSRQLGHSTTTLTETHYARWIPEGDVYCAPMTLEPGEVPADLLARLAQVPTGSPQIAAAASARAEDVAEMLGLAAS